MHGTRPPPLQVRLTFGYTAGVMRAALGLCGARSHDGRCCHRPPTFIVRPVLPRIHSMPLLPLLNQAQLRSYGIGLDLPMSCQEPGVYEYACKSMQKCIKCGKKQCCARPLPCCNVWRFARLLRVRAPCLLSVCSTVLCVDASRRTA